MPCHAMPCHVILNSYDATEQGKPGKPGKPGKRGKPAGSGLCAATSATVANRSSTGLARSRLGLLERVRRAATRESREKDQDSPCSSSKKSGWLASWR